MIIVENVTKYYGDRAAVRDVSFTIREGEIVGLLGLNGAGKTTTLKMLSGVILPTAGRLTIAGIDISQDPDALRARIGFLPETPPLYPEMRVIDFLLFVARIKGVRADVERRVESAIAAADLGEVREQLIGTLSHGYQKRVGIAQAIVHEPALILLDEPTSGLDPKQVVHMRKLIRTLGERHTVIVSSHILSEIQQLCDRIIVLNKGAIAAVGTEAELAQRMATSTTVSIEVRGEREALATALAKAASVARHTIDAEADGLTQATVELKDDGREELARELVQAGLGLRRLERVGLELESIFLKLTGTESQSSEVQS